MGNSKVFFVKVLFFTYSQSSGASGSLVTRLTRLTLKEGKGYIKNQKIYISKCSFSSVGFI